MEEAGTEAASVTEDLPGTIMYVIRLTTHLWEERLSVLEPGEGGAGGGVQLTLQHSVLVVAQQGQAGRAG